MTATDWQLVIGAITFVLSVSVSAFISGSKWGMVTTKLDVMEKQQAKAATTDDLHSMDNRLARIEGLFEMKLKE